MYVYLIFIYSNTCVTCAKIVEKYSNTTIMVQHNSVIITAIPEKKLSV